MTLTGSTVFITGGTGFIGGRLAEVLTAQYGVRVRALVRNSNSGGGSYRLASCGAELIEGDITDEAGMLAALEGCDYVFHCAFGASGDDRRDRQVTVEGTASLAKAAAVRKVRHFVNLSTMVVFGETPPVVDESFTPQKMWDWAYPRAKLEAEQALIAEHARSGLAVTTLRLGTIYGPWGPAFTYYPISCLTSGKVVLVDEGRGISNAAYIDDVIQAMILAAQRDAAEPELFIIRGPDRVTWRQFYDSYERMLGTDSLVSMTQEEVKAETRKRALAAVKGVVPAALGVLKRDAQFKSLAGKLPGLKPLWKFYRRHSGAPATGPVGSVVSPAAPPPFLHVLPPQMWGYYQSQTDYRIDRARTVLGYEPQYDLAKGMALTAAWADWAGLIPRK